jgi:hypothetical protein
MNRAFFTLSALAGVVAIGVLLAAVRAYREPATSLDGAGRTEQVVGLVLLVLGAVGFGAAVFSDSEDLGGAWFVPPALMLAVTAALGVRRPDLAGRLLLWSAAIVLPLTFLIGVIVSGSVGNRPFVATLHNATGAVGFVLFYAVPAAVTGALLYVAARHRRSANGTRRSRLV